MFKKLVYFTTQKKLTVVLPDPIFVITRCNDATTNFGHKVFNLHHSLGVEFVHHFVVLGHFGKGMRESFIGQHANPIPEIMKSTLRNKHKSFNHFKL